MKQEIISELSGKSLLILGFGREGRSTYNFLKTHNVNCKIGIADKNNITDEEILKDNVTLHIGENYIDAMNNYDLIMKSPGISLKDVDLTNVKNKITSQTELFLKYGKDKIIGITGTKGKSTTSSLIYNMIKNKYKTLLVGNIGLPAFNMIDEFENTDYYVYELSSHQLEFVRHSPHIAVLLNMFEDHLDHYVSYEAYKEAKRNIFKHQEKNDWYVLNEEMEDVLNLDNEIVANTIKVASAETNALNHTSYTEKEVDITIKDKIYNVQLPEKINLNGKHNIYNIAVAMSVAKLLDVPDDDLQEGLNTFKALPHRLETIGVYDSVTYIDDSIATIPEAVISAVNSMDNVDTVLIGGMDRNIDYDNLIEFIIENNVPNVILMYDSGKRIYNEVKKHSTLSNIIYAETLEKAVELAVQITEKNKICLLSPAAASYGIFKNFEERGDKFKEYVIKYNKTTK